MKQKNIEHSIVNRTKFSLNTIPLDARLIKGEAYLEEEDNNQFKNKPIQIEELNYKGIVRKTPYSPISSIYKQEF